MPIGLRGRGDPHEAAERLVSFARSSPRSIAFRFPRGSFVVVSEPDGRRNRLELCDEAIRLAKLLAVLVPDEPEALGLLALMLFHDSRRNARVDEEGELVLLEQQDRALWDRQRIAEAERVLKRALSYRSAGWRSSTRSEVSTEGVRPP
jgi:predicted RNA polymerase sigma factor